MWGEGGEVYGLFTDVETIGLVPLWKGKGGS